MIGETLIKIFIPNTDSWIVLQTPSHCYYLKLGGFERIDSFERDQFKEMKLPPEKLRIEDYLTDGETTYFVLDQNKVIEHGLGWIDGEGNTTFSIEIKNKDEYEDGFFESNELNRLVLADDKFSRIVKEG